MQNQNIPIELLLGTQIDKQKKEPLGFNSFQRSDGQKKMMRDGSQQKCLQKFLKTDLAPSIKE